jgi:hypothetical protein
MLEPRRLRTLWASTACYRDSFTFTLQDTTAIWSKFRLVLTRVLHAKYFGLSLYEKRICISLWRYGYLWEFYINTPNVATAVQWLVLMNRIRETPASNLVSALLTGFPWYSSVPVGKRFDFNWNYGNTASFQIRKHSLLDDDPKTDDK